LQNQPTTAGSAERTVQDIRAADDLSNLPPPWPIFTSAREFHLNSYSDV